MRHEQVPLDDVVSATEFYALLPKYSGRLKEN